jgi:hypothetical protein
MMSLTKVSWLSNWTGDSWGLKIKALGFPTVYPLPYFDIAIIDTLEISFAINNLVLQV